jgi:FixJ family two-component response regulator
MSATRPSASLTTTPRSAGVWDGCCAPLATRSRRSRQSAREFLKRGDLDGLGCLVVDVRMPGENGLDLQQVLVAQGHTIPIIFITGHGDIAMAVRAMKMGAVDFLTKPFDDQALLDAVQQALKRER